MLTVGTSLLLTAAHRPALATLRACSTDASANRELFIFEGEELTGLAQLEETVRLAVGGLVGVMTESASSSSAMA